MSEALEWCAFGLAVSHADGKIPHGPNLPEKMPWAGDLFVKEEVNGTDTLYVWMNTGWYLGVPSLVRPKSK